MCTLLRHNIMVVVHTVHDGLFCLGLCWCWPVMHLPCWSLSTTECISNGHVSVKTGPEGGLHWQFMWMTGWVFTWRTHGRRMHCVMKACGSAVVVCWQPVGPPVHMGGTLTHTTYLSTVADHQVSNRNNRFVPPATEQTWFRDGLRRTSLDLHLPEGNPIEHPRDVIHHSFILLARYHNPPSKVWRGPRFIGSGLLEQLKRDQHNIRWVVSLLFYILSDIGFRGKTICIHLWNLHFAPFMTFYRDTWSFHVHPLPSGAERATEGIQFLPLYVSSLIRLQQK